MGLTKFPNGVDTFIAPSNYTVVTGDITAVPNTNYLVTSTAEITLPAMERAICYTFINGGEDGQVQITIDPDAGDGILYAGAVSDGDYLRNTLATAKKGDYVTIVSLASTAYFVVSDVNGTWETE